LQQRLGGHVTPEIIRASRNDAERLTTLMLRSAAYQGQYASILAGYRVSPDYIDRHLVFAAVNAHRDVVGFYALLSDAPELDLLFVADNAQSAGVGRALVGHMLTQARAAGLSTVRVVAHPPAEGFYRRLGARRGATVPAAPPRVTWERPEMWFDVDRDQQ
jgi:GNAT superfamily N-acetyltransferase